MKPLNEIDAKDSSLEGANSNENAGSVNSNVNNAASIELSPEVKPKNEKFKKLINFVVNATLVCNVAWYACGYDKVVPESWEARLFGQSPVEGQALEIKHSFDKNYSYLLDVFKADENLDKIKDLKVRTRLTFSLTNYFSQNKSSHSYPIFNYINVPIPNMTEEYEQSQNLKEKVATNLKHGIPASTTMKKTFLEEGSISMIYNFFLNLEDAEKKLVPDFFYFHEFTHSFFENKVDSINDDIEKDFKKQGIKYKKNDSHVLEESMSDVMGAILTIEKHNLNQTDSIHFIESMMAVRFVVRTLAQAGKPNDSNIKHDTEFALYSLIQEIKKQGLVKFKKQSIKEKELLALDYAKRSVYYAKYNSEQKVSDMHANALARYAFPKDKIEDSFDTEDLFNSADEKINHIAHTRSFFIQTVLNGDLNGMIKKISKP